MGAFICSARSGILGSKSTLLSSSPSPPLINLLLRFGTAAVVRGLKEAGEDDTIGAVVLRIDSGGGGVVESDTIWAAVRDLREKHGKTVVASFGNASASGGYLVSTRKCSQSGIGRVAELIFEICRRRRCHHRCSYVVCCYTRAEVLTRNQRAASTVTGSYVRMSPRRLTFADWLTSTASELLRYDQHSSPRSSTAFTSPLTRSSLALAHKTSLID